MGRRRVTRFGWALLLALPVLAAITLLAPTGWVVAAWLVFVFVILMAGLGTSPGIQGAPRADPMGNVYGDVDPGEAAEERYDERHGIR
jgi:hypothetical protein